MSALSGTFVEGGLLSGPGVVGQDKIPSVSMLMVTVNVTAVTGTATPSLDIWLEGSDDGGTTWFAIPYDQQLTHTTTAGDQVANTNKRNINGTAACTAVNKYSAFYKHVSAQKVRLNSGVTGTFTTGQGFTVSAKWQGK